MGGAEGGQLEAPALALHRHRRANLGGAVPGLGLRAETRRSAFRDLRPTAWYYHKQSVGRIIMTRRNAHRSSQHRTVNPPNAVSDAWLARWQLNMRASIPAQTKSHMQCPELWPTDHTSARASCPIERDGASTEKSSHRCGEMR